jgi:hypothetical protein
MLSGFAGTDTSDSPGKSGSCLKNCLKPPWANLSSEQRMNAILSTEDEPQRSLGISTANHPIRELDRIDFPRSAD